MLNSDWDIFCSSEAAGSLYFGYHLARSLSERRRTVRLFTDDIHLLSRSVAAVDAELWVQSVMGFELVDIRLARLCTAARHVAEVFGAGVPYEYTSRFMQQQALCHWVNLGASDSARGTQQSITVLAQTETTSNYLVQLGDLPRHAGYVRSRTDAPAMRRRWAEPARRGSLAALLGAPGEVMHGAKMVFASASHHVDAAAWLDAMERSAQPASLLLGPCGMQSAVAELLNLPLTHDAQMCRRGAVTIVVLPPVMWYALEELIWAADVVVTDERDTAARAAEGGTPLIWLDEAPADSAYIDWYTSAAPDELRRQLVATSAALASSSPGFEWKMYLARLDDMVTMAGGVAERIRRGPELADVLLAGVAGMDTRAIERMFAPTAPAVEAE